MHIKKNNYRLNQFEKGKYEQNCLSTEPAHIDNNRFIICQQDDDNDNNCEPGISNRYIARQTIVSRIIIFPLSWDRLPSWGNIRGYFKRGETCATYQTDKELVSPQPNVSESNIFWYDVNVKVF